MQYEMNDWMRYVPDDPVPVCALTSAQQERIRRLTMNKIQGKRPRRAWRAVLAAACAAVLLCGSAFAAQRLGLFDLAAFLGMTEENAGRYVVQYESEAAAAFDGVRYTLETLLTDERAIYAVVRAEPETTDAALQEVWLSISPGISGTARCEVLEKTDGCWRYLVCYACGEQALPSGETVQLCIQPAQDRAGEPLFTVQTPDEAAPAMQWALDGGRMLRLTAFSLCVTTPYDSAADDALLAADADRSTLLFNRLARSPETVRLIFSDGSTLMIDGAYWDYEAQGADGEHFFLGDTMADRDTFYRVGVFARMIDLSELSAVEVDGDVYTPADAGA
mgnify:FL=1